MRLLLLAAMLSAACGGYQGTFRWPSPPGVQDGATSPECRTAVDKAVSFWQSQGVALTVGEQILVSEYQSQGPRVGFTAIAPDGKHAFVNIGVCDAQVAAHEIGHALGLVHPVERDAKDCTDPLAKRLMFPWTCGGWELSQQELDHVR